MQMRLTLEKRIFFQLVQQIKKLKTADSALFKEPPGV